jgi:hypothetical protein
LSGFLAALAVFTLVLERNHEILTNYDTIWKIISLVIRKRLYLVNQNM